MPIGHRGGSVLSHPVPRAIGSRRLTANLKKFRHVLLDFDGVRSVGQGCADEVFRVFASRRPETSIEAVNVSPGVHAMLKHAGLGAQASECSPC
jgi:hypothetical protein